MSTSFLVYLASLNHGDKPGFVGDVFPIQLGLLAAYAQSRLGNAVELRLFSGIADLDAAVVQRPPDLIGFSRYMWNADLVSRCISAIKSQHPQIITVVGGPDYPLELEARKAWLVHNADVDFYIYQDGEIPFTTLLEAILAGRSVAELKSIGVPGCHTISEGVPVFGPDVPRVRNLDDIPSPYLSGFMDQFFETGMRPLMMTSRGCPYSCTYCVEGSNYYNSVTFTSQERRSAELNYIAEHVKNSPVLMLVDSNFGQFSGDPEFARKVGELRRRTGYPDYLFCSAGKAHSERIVQCRELAGDGTMRLAASVQTLDPVILSNVKRRNLPLPELLDIGNTTGQQGSNPCDLILGLPGESLASAISSMEGVMDLGVGAVIQRQFAMLRGSESEQGESRQRFALHTRFRPLVGCAGKYLFCGQEIRSVECEEIVVGSNLFDFQDYLDARRYYFTIALFFNDWMFGEIRALLRAMNLPVSSWIRRLHEESHLMPVALQKIYTDFEAATAGELWDTSEEIITWMLLDESRWKAGGPGQNLLYQFRVKALFHHWDDLVAYAFACLRRHLEEHRPGDHSRDLAEEAERYFQGAKRGILDLDREEYGTFVFDWIHIMESPSEEALIPLSEPRRLRFCHSANQREMLKNALHQVGSDGNQLGYMLSRYPISRFFRSAEAETDL
jgi:radical SAM superfamily enzyme YgiQ (UPF0313 family)